MLINSQEAIELPRLPVNGYVAKLISFKQKSKILFKWTVDLCDVHFNKPVQMDSFPFWNFVN